MDHDIQIAMLAYIDALHRSVEVNEHFAEHLVALAQVVEAQPDRSGTSAPLLDLARRHRVAAIKGLAKIAVASRQFAERFGVEPLQRDR